MFHYPNYNYYLYDLVKFNYLIFINPAFYSNSYTLNVLLFLFDLLITRLKQAVKVGFKHLVFEDNYDTGTGDHYSLRQICDQPYIRGICFLS